MKERFLSILKFVLALLLLPVVIAVTVSFLENIGRLARYISASFGWGVISYLALHILFYEPAKVFDTGKKMTEKTIGFLSPWLKVAGFCVPIFTVFCFFAYYIASLAVRRYDLLPFFVFLAAFTLTMHLVMTANSLKKKQPGWLKENYLFSIFAVYIINMLIVVLAFALLNADFSLARFFDRAGDVAGAIYTASFNQLFVVEGRNV